MRTIIIQITWVGADDYLSYFFCLKKRNYFHVLVLFFKRMNIHTRIIHEEWKQVIIVLNRNHRIYILTKYDVNKYKKRAWLASICIHNSNFQYIRSVVFVIISFLYCLACHFFLFKRKWGMEKKTFYVYIQSLSNATMNNKREWTSTTKMMG